MEERELRRFRVAKELLDEMFGDAEWYVGAHYWPNARGPVGLQVYSLEDSELVARMVPNKLNGVYIKIWAGANAKEMFEFMTNKKTGEKENG